MSFRGKRNKVEADKATLELYLDLHNRGINIGADKIALLQKEGLLDPPPQIEVPKQKEHEAEAPVIIPAAAEANKKADEHFTVTFDTSGSDHDQVISEKEYREKVASKSVFDGSIKEITRKMWLPESKVYHTKEFVAWIDSINREDGFWNSISYKPFDTYCQQADQWLAEVPDENMTDAEYEEWQLREIERCCENTLYACNKYGKIRDNNEHGLKDYIARKAHRIILYLLDCGYSMNIAKARQVAFTTTLCMAAMIKAGFSLDLVIKFISETDKKAQVTFDTKVKYPYSMLPTWMRPEARNDNIRELYFGVRKKKGVTDGNNSSIEVLAPTTTAIASSTPDYTFIDEGGNIDILNKLIADLEPTLYGFNTKTNQQELMRCMVLWGTGGEMETFGAAFAALYNKHLDDWNNRRFGNGIVPLFFNVWWRPGFTRERYEQLKAEAYAMEGPKAMEMRIRFHQSYPVTLQDVFLTGGKTLKPLEWITNQLDRIARSGEVPDYGFFEPVYDYNEPAHEGSDVPFKIIGANFVPCSIGDERVTTIIFDHPRKWINRYFQGTDPIAADNGHSKMASAVWDAYFGTPVAVMNFRTDNYRYVFLQNALLGIYYNADPDKVALDELVEANIGTAYREYKENKDLGRTLVLNSELPPLLQTRNNSTQVGIDNKSLRTAQIINTLHQIFDAFGEKIWISVFFTQLRTFTCKQVGRTEVWEPTDKKNYWDDTLFALVYSYLCSQCFAHRIPKSIEGEKALEHKKKQVRYELYRSPDGQLSRRIKRPAA